MSLVSKEDLKKIAGGSNAISGPIINAIVNVIELIENIGKDFGASLRRIKEDNLCPLK